MFNHVVECRRELADLIGRPRLADAPAQVRPGLYIPGCACDLLHGSKCPLQRQETRRRHEDNRGEHAGEQSQPQPAHGRVHELERLGHLQDQGPILQVQRCRQDAHSRAVGGTDRAGRLFARVGQGR